MDATASAVIHRDLQHVYPTIVRGEGIYLYDADGNRYIDGSGGSAAVTAIGHGVPEIVAAMTEQASRVAYAPTHAFTTEAVEACAQLIVEEFAPPGFGNVWFVSGGSEAADNAVKMAVQYHRERGEGTRRLIIGRWQSFHGATIAALAFGGNAGRRRPYDAILPHAEHIPPCNPYRCWANHACPTCDLSCADALERTIRQVGPENVAAFIAEPVVGATMGAVPATPGYFARIREICDRYGVLFIADEVMTGFGRTGRNFGIEHWGVTPDLITCAKGISAGYTPLGAVLARPEFVSEISRRGHSFVIGHTSSGNPLSCAVGTAVLRYIRDRDLVANAAAVGAYFLGRLRALQDRHPMVGDARGLGLLCGVEFVQNRATKRPFPPDWRVSKRVAAATLARGLISYPGSGTVDGVAGDHLLYAPPLTISHEQIDDLVAILDESLTAVAADLARDGRGAL
ncbi:MAG: aspartate aminotransferase family protein [Thermomicrobiales bacterium]|nr:aspartate aminotransferase family protein [Thermomicrobiales bacterium]